MKKPNSRKSIRETEVSDFYNVKMDKTHAYLNLDKYELCNIFFHSFGIIGNEDNSPLRNKNSSFYCEDAFLSIVNEPKAEVWKVSFAEIKELVEYHDKNFDAIEKAHVAGLEEYLHQKNRFYNLLYKINSMVESGEHKS